MLSVRVVSKSWRLHINQITVLGPQSYKIDEDGSISVAGLPWIEQVLDYLLQQMPANKISLGIPLYSYYWSPTADAQGGHVKGTGLAYQKTMEILEQHQASMHWDEKQKVSYTFFPKQNIFEYLFIENAQSFQEKLELVKKYNLRGFSAWRLGLEDHKIWEILR